MLIEKYIFLLKRTCNFKKMHTLIIDNLKWTQASRYTKSKSWYFFFLFQSLMKVKYRKNTSLWVASNFQVNIYNCIRVNFNLILYLEFDNSCSVRVTLFKDKNANIKSEKKDNSFDWLIQICKTSLKNRFKCWYF